MPIFDLSYQGWDGRPGPRSQRWIPIAIEGAQPLFRRRAFLFWLFVCWAPALICGAIMYVTVNFAAGGGFDDSPLFNGEPGSFRTFYLWQIFFCVLTSVFVGAGLIANDRRTQALQIYLSKPLRATDYLLGKAAAVGGVLAMVAFGPALALYLMRVGLDENGGFFTSHLALPFQLTAASLLIVVTLTVLSLTVSSFARSGRTAGVVLVMVYLFFEAVRVILGLFLGRGVTSLLSPISNLLQGLDWIFGQLPGFQIHPMVSLAALAAMLALCLALLWRRVRPVEVIR